MAVTDPFHLAIQVRDIDEARRFYGEFLGCPEGRSSQAWVDFDLYGHQFVCHLNPALNTGDAAASAAHKNPVDGHGVPVPHFGVVLEMEAWQALADKLKAHGIAFEIEPYIRFKGEPGEQATMFFKDPSGNALEFKAFKDRENQLFRK
ncbi:VOC family protein [Halomonas halocynthiae]|uniref:VOC family protein n=1 Tax=Halomonas halocynthiae TaxID=176290 RepID=UPI000420BD8D|nr:VOC family protein [Halomonas halocynthiae]